MRVLTWSRVALVTASVGIMAVVVGCGAAPSGSDPTDEGANATQRASSKEHTEGLVLGPITLASSPLWTETIYGSASECTDTSVAIPAALEGYGCTLGARYSDGAAAETWYYAWACPTTLPASVIPSDGGFGIVTGEGLGEEAWATSYQQAGFGCFGLPVSGYELVVDEAIREHIRGGCNGGTCGLLPP